MPAAHGAETSAAGAAMLAPFVGELDRIAPSFQMHGSRIRLLQTPADFFETLQAKIRRAERRIFLSTLYIGRSETALMAALQEALRSKPGLKLGILTDALRGTREAPEPSCASLLAPLVAEFGPDRVEIRMYHTPNLTGLRKKHMPRRINEGWGLQHMKLYGFDDEIILSGANLSSDYFTNRQDRYHLFASSDMTEYFSNLFGAVASLSYLVQPSQSAAGFELSWPDTNTGPSPLDDPARFVAESTSLLSGLISPRTAPLTRHDQDVQADTSVYVLAQLSQLLRPDRSTELPALTRVLELLADPRYAASSWTFTAGYFNPARSLTRLLLATASRANTVITAAPQANGFFGSAGVSGLLPDAYTLLARRFLYAVHAHGRDADIGLREWRRGTVGAPDGWTYHAKGLWVTLPGGADVGPSLTVVGSSNYTRRSYSLDLEAGALVVTENEALRRRLAEEQRWLGAHAEVVTRDDLARNERRVGLRVRVALWIVQMLGGAL